MRWIHWRRHQGGAKLFFFYYGFVNAPTGAVITEQVPINTNLSLTSGLTRVGIWEAKQLQSASVPNYCIQMQKQELQRDRTHLSPSNMQIYTPSLSFARTVRLREIGTSISEQARVPIFPLLAREASKRVPIFDRGTGSEPERLRSGFPAG